MSILPFSSGLQRPGALLPVTGALALDTVTLELPPLSEHTLSNGSSRRFSSFFIAFLIKQDHCSLDRRFDDDRCILVVDTPCARRNEVADDHVFFQPS